MKIGIFGDVHGNWDRLLEKIAAAQKEHAIDAAIQVGDLGLSRQRLELFRARGQVFPIPVYAIDGNHENHRFIRASCADASVRSWEDLGLHFQPRGSVRALGGATIGFLGGALHADRRQEGSIDKHTTNWITDAECRNALVAFHEHPLDLLVTHSCPHSIGIGMIGDPQLIELAARYITGAGFDPGPFDDCGEPALTSLWIRLLSKPRWWVFGHFHHHRQTCVDGVTFTCVGSADGDSGDDSRITYVFDTDARELASHVRQG